MISITNQQLIYQVALILSTTRKTCEAMASLAGKSGDTFCALLKEKSGTPRNDNRTHDEIWDLFIICQIINKKLSHKLKQVSLILIQ